jgi:dTDP-glucose 4,6-dehydratase
MIKKILVTGNCGFIGQNFARMFAGEHYLFGVDKMGYASDPDALEVIPTFMADISNVRVMERIFSMTRPDAVINFAAESHVDRSIQDADPFIRSNVVGTHVLLEMAVKFRVERFMQVSTDEVYGDLQPDDPPFSKLHELRPSSPYSASKAAADMLVLAWHRTHNLDVVITRTVNNYGPYQYTEKLIPVVVHQAMSDEPIPVYGTGSNIREWIHVRDNCRALNEVLLRGRSGGIYNIGSGVEMTNLDLVKTILAIMEKPESLISFVTDRKGHDLRYALDSILLRDELGWEPEIGLDTGLRETIQWYKDNPDHWEVDTGLRETIQWCKDNPDHWEV